MILKMVNDPYCIHSKCDYGVVVPIERVVKGREYPHENMWIENIIIVPYSIQDSKQDVQTKTKMKCLMINPRSVCFLPVTSVQCYQDIVEAVLHFWSAKVISDFVLIGVLSFSFRENVL